MTRASDRYIEPPPDPNAFDAEFKRIPKGHPWAGSYSYGLQILEITPTRWRASDISDQVDPDPPHGRVLEAGDHLRLTGSSDTYDLVVIHWSSRTYLVPARSLADFASAVNLGIEPRHSVSIFDGASGYLRHGDEQKPVTGRPLLPPSFRKYFIDREITAKILRVGKPFKENKYFLPIQLNVGRAQGVIYGMQFRPRDKRISGIAHIVKAGENLSYAIYGLDWERKSPPKAGWEMTTGQAPPP
jgi:hypothetical protein